MKPHIGCTLTLLAPLSGCGSSPAPQQGRPDDCAEYRETIAGKSDEEKPKAAEAHIVRMHGSADSAHIERHLRMIEQRCGS